MLIRDKIYNMNQEAKGSSPDQEPQVPYHLWEDPLLLSYVDADPALASKIEACKQGIDFVEKRGSDVDYAILEQAEIALGTFVADKTYPLQGPPKTNPEQR